MTHVFVSGATGYIGTRLVIKLAEEGYCVHALYRDENKTKGFKSDNIKLYKGDLNNPDSLVNAMIDCDCVFHIAALAKLWSRDKSDFYNTNVVGTQNIIAAAIATKVRRCIFTSTAGVYDASIAGPITEESAVSSSLFSDYEETKYEADKIIMNEPSRMEMIIVRPTRVFGPGNMSESNGVTRLIQMYARGKWHIIPGNGTAMANYVFIDDVVMGHIQAYKYGCDKECYILGGENVSYNQFFTALQHSTGRYYYLFKLPKCAMLFIAYIMQGYTKVCSSSPLITTKMVRKFLANWNVSSNKAMNEINYQPTMFTEGLEQTVAWLKRSQML
ncbi:NAD-dependent epimerase/dehydratase family protein [Carboxylicivirga marina]|uniref:NAD-dependent epimerase/dehydratase family protein n=1 Tax=Carboxylicivirga marina TaxID=2800988 RepID=A0ABS1HNI1_9BACT|nr:NAD-dependent epimerase/dehydratase family protein [Carboxylicivirga marina]MBK3519196.1 NAD-dependent epimerase/dehydratase family protein [Carboxylicivirga marina]